jgi:hypothetical protein
MENWAKTDTTIPQTTPKATTNKTTNKRSQPTTTTNRQHKEHHPAMKNN